MRSTFSTVREDKREVVAAALKAAIDILREDTGRVPDVAASEAAVLAEDTANTPDEVREMGPLAVLIDAAADRLCQLIDPREVFVQLQDTSNNILAAHFEEDQKIAALKAAIDRMEGEGNVPN